MPRKYIFPNTNTTRIFILHPLSIWEQTERTAKSQDGQRKGTLAHVKRKVATALSMKMKPVKKYRHSCAFAPISAFEACLETLSHPYIFVLLQFL